MRDNNCLRYTLHLCMKHNKQYFIFYLKVRQCPGVSVECSKLIVWVQCNVLSIDIEHMHHTQIQRNSHRRDTNRTRNDVINSCKIILTLILEVYTDQMRFAHKGYISCRCLLPSCLQSLCDAWNLICHQTILANRFLAKHSINDGTQIATTQCMADT